MKLLYLLLLLIPLNLNASEVLEIVIREHHFVPSVVKAPANKKFKLVVINEDESAEEFESFDLKREKIVPGKGKINVNLGPLKPGEYNFFGEFHHKTAQGKLIAK